MTKQITVKLNEARFKPLMDKLMSFAGEGTTESYSDLVGKALFYCYYNIYYKKPDMGNRSTFDIMTEMAGKEKPELVLRFLGEYYKFKKSGLPKNNNKK